MMLRTVLSVARAAMFAYALASDRPADLVVVAWFIGFTAITVKADVMAFDDGYRRCDEVVRRTLGLPPPSDD